MKTKKARFNCGYWIWDCDICNSGNRAAPGTKMVFCGGCYPDKFAKKEVMVEGVVLRGIDRKKQEAAKRRAWANGGVYKISFPRNHKALVETVRCRLEEHQSWEPGETIQDLEAENESHPKLGYLKLKKVKKEEEVPVVEEVRDPLPELDDEILGGIL